VTDIVGTLGKITGESRGSAVGQEIDADASGGRSKCMPARQLARSGRGRHKRQFPVSDAASRKVHRVRNAGDEPLPRPGSARRSSASGWTTARVPRKRHAGCPYANTCGRRGRGETPCRSARPYGENGTGMTGEPRAGDERGVMTHVRIRRWGNGPAEQAARSLRRYLEARSRAACWRGGRPSN
jgi:hypothetical protein